MKVAAVFTILLLFKFLPHVPAKSNHQKEFKCIGCTYIFAMLDQLSFLHNETIGQSAVRFCSFLPNENLVDVCKITVIPFKSWLNHLYHADTTPDTVCQSLHLCDQVEGKYCHLFPKKKSDLLQKHIEMRQYFPAADKLAKSVITLKKTEEDFSNVEFFCNLPFLREICFAFKNYFKHLPLYDRDGDLFSQKDTFRGAYWRGKDCNDSDAKIHPGIRPINSDIHTDSNCNGIYGTDSQGRPYEDIFCKNSSQRGFAVIGDSVAAHLHLPEEWFDAKKISKDSLKNMLMIVQNEFDWPQLSSSTGFMNSSWDIVNGPTDSIYYRLWERNHCVHRDFQNIGINGASTFTQLKFVKSLSRKPSDYPLIVNYGLVGNDVCNRYPDTFKHMTTPKEMFNNTMHTLKYLDTTLPKGSFVIMYGLVDGRQLYDNMHDRICPLGKTRNDVTYKQYYDYLTCLELSMCSGWLTSNKTQRDMTKHRADQLNEVLKNIVKTQNNFTNFRVYYIGGLFKKLIESWKKLGGNAWQIIDKTDGFHNNQFGQSVASKVVWDIIEKQFPEILGPVNPHNQKIKKIFGDQDGY